MNSDKAELLRQLGWDDAMIDAVSTGAVRDSGVLTPEISTSVVTVLSDFESANASFSSVGGEMVDNQIRLRGHE